MPGRVKAAGGCIGPKSMVPSRESKEGEWMVGATTGSQRVPVADDREGAGGSGGSGLNQERAGGSGGSGLDDGDGGNGGNGGNRGSDSSVLDRFPGNENSCLGGLYRGGFQRFLSLA